MSCRHCQGTITVESYIDAEEDGYGLRWISAWHCVNCGQVPAASSEPSDRLPAPSTRRRAVGATRRVRKIGAPVPALLSA